MTKIEKAEAIVQITKELNKIADRLYEQCGLPPYVDGRYPYKNNDYEGVDDEDDDFFDPYFDPYPDDEVRE